MKKERLITYTLSHFCVDFLCVLILYGTFSHLSSAVYAFLTYHILGFGLQPLAGYFNDSHLKLSAGALGSLLVLIACIFTLLNSWIAVILAGIGNALFHVGGGYVSLHHGTNKLNFGGIFVAGGALGVALGTILGKAIPLWAIAIIGIIIGGISLIISAKNDISVTEKMTPTCFTLVRTNLNLTLVLIITIFSIIIRGYAGLILPLDWKTQLWMSLITAMVMTLGKGLGGFLADRFGARKVCFIALLLAIPCVWCSNIMVISLIGIFLLNVPMSVTLAILCQCFPNNTGFAFGLAPLGLFIGYILALFAIPSGFSAKILISFLYIISAGMIYFILKGNKAK